MQDQPANSQPQTSGSSYVDTYTPPTTDQASAPPDPVSEPTMVAPTVSSAPAAAQAPAEASMPPTSSPTRPTVSQTLEDQNIFFLLGVEDGNDDEKEAFLDELQQVIWEDFLDRDVELLVTEEEMEGLKKLMVQKDKSELQLQEDMVVYLEKLIPDLEEILLEKALELKEDMVRERLVSMREMAAGKEDVLAKIAQAETLVNDNQWRAAAEVLNAVPA